MFLSTINIGHGLINTEIILNNLIQEWENKYKQSLERLYSQYSIDSRNSPSSNDSDIESSDAAIKLLKEAIKCKAFIDVEYKAIQDIRAELEDCHMVKELGATLQQLSEEKEVQSKEIEKLRDKNWQLHQEKEKLEQCLHDMYIKSPQRNDDSGCRKTILAEKLESFRNRAQPNKRITQTSDYCHIAPTMNILSDSERSISEEDSLEKGKTKDVVFSKDCELSPIKFNSGLMHASKSTPIKSNDDHNSQSPKSEVNGNLTQDLKDIHKYLNDHHDDPYINHQSIIDWDMSQLSVDDSKDKIIEADLHVGIEHPNFKKAEGSVLVESKVPSNTAHLITELDLEKEKYESLAGHITRLYDLVNGSTAADIKQIPNSSGDEPDEQCKASDPVKQIYYIQEVLENKSYLENKGETVQSDLNILNGNERSISEIEPNSLNVFKSLSEASVRLLTEIVNNLSNIDFILSEKKPETNIVDNTSLVMDYLQYLISLNQIDFSNEDAKRHPIYDLVRSLENNVQCLLNKLASIEKDKNGLSEALELFYQEQLNKCYDDISQLKRQLDTSQQLLSNKMPIDTAEALFEAKQKLHEELKSVDREYSRQMSREKKRLEESEAQYNDLLTDYENIQKKYTEDVTALKLSIEHLQRQHENDKKFIDQQHFEWDLERSQHNVDIDNLNKTICRIKRSSSYSDSLSDCGQSPVKGQLQKSNSLPKSKSPHKHPVICLDCTSQTDSENIIVLVKRVTRQDLERYLEFKPILTEFAESGRALLGVVHDLSDIILDIVEGEEILTRLPNLLELNEKDYDNLPVYYNSFWKNVKTDIFKVKEFLVEFVKEKGHFMLDYDRVQEELEINKTNLTIKQDQINALEDEVQNLMEFQRNLSNDYDLVQEMLEEKQTAIDDLSNNLLSTNSIEDYEDSIKKLKKELSEKQNIIDERDEDLYVLKEDKESVDQKLFDLQKQFDENISSHREIYEDLEHEFKECQNSNRELHEQMTDFLDRYNQQAKEIEEMGILESSLRDTILNLTRDNEILTQKISSVLDERNLSQLRLAELEHQHKNNVEKLTRNLKETEQSNRVLLNSVSSRPCIFVNVGCQTESLINGDNLNTEMNEQLSLTITKLKEECTSEKDKRQQIELKYRQFVSQYEALSNKVFSLEASVGDPKFLTSFENDNMNESVESFDRNTFMHASQTSLQSFDEDLDINLSMRLNQEKNAEEAYEQFRSVACQTISDVSMIKNDINVTLRENNYGVVISDWLEDLLTEVENVLQSCVIGDNISAEVLAKVSKFRHLLEQMYKRQLVVLLEKISNLEKDLQCERKNNFELNNKANFLMTEVQESESVQVNLKNRLDQVLSENSRITESHRIISDKLRTCKIDYGEQINKIKDELEVERYKCSDAGRQLKNEQRRREHLESALSVANERSHLVEQSNTELIKKSRQQMDYQQKEMDSLNSEYAEMFRRYNETKLQLETIQQSLHLQTLDCDKAKSELRETIQSNTEYRTKMNEFIKIYQAKRSKLEIEAKELHQLLQISCRREITFIKENETLRMKVQSLQSINKENDKKIKELENCINDLHQRHEDDRLEWLKMINGSIDKKKDDGILTQVNWLLRMLQLRMELLGLHFVPNSGSGSCFNDRSEGGSSELVILLQSIKSMQYMIGVYLNNNQDVSNISCGHSSDCRIQGSFKFDRQPNNFSKRPKPTGSSDSLDSLTDSELSSVQPERVDDQQYTESINTKIYMLQMNKIVDLQMSLNRYERWRQGLLYQKKFILSHLPPKQRFTIEKAALTESEKLNIKEKFFKFKFKAVVLVLVALQRFSKSSKQTDYSLGRTSYLMQACSNVSFPMFSTDTSKKAGARSMSTEDEGIVCSKTSAQVFSKNNTTYSIRQSAEVDAAKSRDNGVVGTGDKMPHSNNAHSSQVARRDVICLPVHSVSPILERPSFQSRLPEPVSATKTQAHRNYSSALKQGLSTSFSNNSLRSSLKSPLQPQSLVSSLDRNLVGKTTNLSSTIRQIDDFGKRLDKYTDRVTGL